MGLGKRKPRKKLTLLASAAALSNAAASNAAAASVLVTPKSVGRPSKKKTKKNRNSMTEMIEEKHHLNLQQ